MSHQCDFLRLEWDDIVVELHDTMVHDGIHTPDLLKSHQANATKIGWMPDWCGVQLFCLPNAISTTLIVGGMC